MRHDSRQQLEASKVRKHYPGLSSQPRTPVNLKQAKSAQRLKVLQNEVLKHPTADSRGCISGTTVIQSLELDHLFTASFSFRSSCGQGFPLVPVSCSSFDAYCSRLYTKTILLLPFGTPPSPLNRVLGHEAVSFLSAASKFAETKSV